MYARAVLMGIFTLVTLSGCATFRGLAAGDTEQLLAAAGFQKFPWRGRRSGSTGIVQKQALRIKARSFTPVEFSVEDKPFDFLGGYRSGPPFVVRQGIPRRRAVDLRCFLGCEHTGREQPAAIH